jgi:hypothetical protein
VTGFAGIDIPRDAGFAGMNAADDFALSAVFYFAWWFGFHLSFSQVLMNFISGAGRAASVGHSLRF